MTDTVQPPPAGAHGQDGETRRDFLTLAASAITGIGAACAVWPLISSMNPSQDVLAAGAPVDIDIKALQPGQQMVVLWRSHPVFIAHRTADELKTLQDPKEISQLRDPEFRRAAAARLRQELAPLGQARISRRRRHLHPSRLHPRVPAQAGQRRAGLGGRLFLPVPRFALRPRGPRLRGRAGALQSAGPAAPLCQRYGHPHRREPAGLDLRPQRRRADLGGTRHGLTLLAEQAREVDRPPAADLRLHAARALRLSDAAQPELLVEFRLARRGHAGDHDRHRHRAGDAVHAQCRSAPSTRSSASCATWSGAGSSATST